MIFPQSDSDRTAGAFYPGIGTLSSTNPQMLLFGDHVAIARAGPRFPTTALTWEAWMLSYDVSPSLTLIIIYSREWNGVYITNADCM